VRLSVPALCERAGKVKDCESPGGGLRAFTLAFWLYARASGALASPRRSHTRAKTSATTRDIAQVTKGISAGGQEFKLSLNGTALVWRLANSSGAWSDTGFTANGAVASLTWKHVAWTWDGQSSVVYVDATAVLATSTSVDYTVAAGTDPLFVGAAGNASAGDEWFEGSIDEFYLFGAYAMRGAICRCARPYASDVPLRRHRPAQRGRPGSQEQDADSLDRRLGSARRLRL
jgi:hypothetical protein